ncbi:MAG: 1,4-dihydroxy-2-naphthoate polyprenyltransferase [Cytophagales bacterium]|nr:MAG: 1,4-dihydroxy-2-naphthoate polyprenyltransferase [Cytophagales bacterium]
MPNTSPTLQDWLSAFRLRTLPLAFSGIGLGAFLAASLQRFNLWICLLSLLTTLFLQVLSNLANDYGDSVHGADSETRKGPQRAVQKGTITASQMLKAIYICSAFAFITGLTLLLVALQNLTDILIFLGLGVLAIIAAITYTAGKRPYGYAGLGDLSVLIFFGGVAVLGSVYLHAHTLKWLFLLPALSAGAFAVGVLNINNIRDIDSDQQAGKKSIPVRIGRKNAIYYHWFLLLAGISSTVVYASQQFTSPVQWLFLLAIPLFIHNGRQVSRFAQEPRQIDPYLKQMALSTLLFVLLFGIGSLL